MLGSLRSAAQMVSYEVPLGLSVVSVLMLAGSASMVEIVRAQAGDHIRSAARIAQHAAKHTLLRDEVERQRVRELGCSHQDRPGYKDRRPGISPAAGESRTEA